MTKGIVRTGITCLFLILSPHSSAATISDLRISEVMLNPAALADSLGEWFELFNPTDQILNLRGLSIEDDGRDRHRFDSDLLILPGEYLTLARSAEPGFTPDYVYSGFGLSNSSDEIVFSDGLSELLRLDYGPGFGAPGQSRELGDLPMLAANYQLSEAVYYRGDRGTPGFGYVKPPLSVPVPVPATITLFLAALAALSLQVLLKSSPLSTISFAVRRQRLPDGSRRGQTSVNPLKLAGDCVHG